VLAFESRVTSEIVWALNTLAIFSCNQAQNLTLENQPYLLESLSNYTIFCIENIRSLNFSDPMEKKNHLICVNVPSYIDSQYTSGLQPSADGTPATLEARLDYRHFGMFTKDLTKR